jgi:hypothetical protein
VTEALATVGICDNFIAMGPGKLNCVNNIDSRIMKWRLRNFVNQSMSGVILLHQGAG